MYDGESEFCHPEGLLKGIFYQTVSWNSVFSFDHASQSEIFITDTLYLVISYLRKCMTS